MKRIIRAGLSILLVNSLLAVAGGQEKKGNFSGGGGYGPRVGGGIERVFGLLTEEQRASFRRAMEGQREKVRNLEQKSGEARRQLLEAALVDKFDEANVRKKLDALMGIDGDLTMLRIKAIAKMEPPITAEQLEKLRGAAGGEGPGSGAAPGPAERKKRPDVPRDENGLPLKK